MLEKLKTDIVILGAGIGGYEAFRTLNRKLKQKGLGAHITIVDVNNYFTFIPLLHEVATGSVEPTHASIPLRELVHDTAHTYINAKVESVDYTKKEVRTTSSVISYEYCVIALGSAVNFYGVPGTKEFTHHVRSLKDALALKYALVENLENSESDECVITIVGGGYVGVEIAGQYGTLKNGDLKKLYPHKKITVRVIEPNNSILSAMKPKMQANVTKRLEKLGVEFIFNNSTTEVTKNSVILKTGEEIRSDITVWAAGFKNLGPQFVEEEKCEKGRIKVDEYLRMTGIESCYVIGDIAYALDGITGKPCPQLAEVAHIQGQFVGGDMVKRLRGKEVKPFVFKSKGQLMPVGDWYGVAIIGGIALYGRFAWWIRRTVYVLYMPGFLRKLRIVFDWTIHSLGFGHFIHIEKK
ncbi:MAG TPA: NAD(P)/FAD-dependent oxidoreductase [Candidatus Magasanikbacteria bacterium]|nr:NAD(P)/FAD-dependent oxidoreductase [Candidatus Magasanikbacteria bacterium]